MLKRDVADWLYAQDTPLACTRVAQWLSTLEEATRDGYDAGHAPIVRAFQERAFTHLWDILEDRFAGHVLPLLSAAQTNESVALARAAAAWLRLLAAVSFPRLAASTTWWSWLQEIVPCQADPESAPLALDPALFLDHLSHGLAQDHPTLSSQTRWHVAHKARELAVLLATLIEARWERYRVHGFFAGSGRGVVRAVWAYVREGGRGQVTHRARLTRDPSGALTAEAVAFERSLSQALRATRQYLRRERHSDGQLDMHLVLEEAGQPAPYEGPSLGLHVGWPG